MRYFLFCFQLAVVKCMDVVGPHMEGQDQTIANNLLQLLHLNKFHHMEEVKNIWILSSLLYFFNLSKKIFKLSSKTLLDFLLQNVILFYLIGT